MNELELVIDLPRGRMKIKNTLEMSNNDLAVFAGFFSVLHALTEGKFKIKRFYSSISDTFDMEVWLDER